MAFCGLREPTHLSFLFPSLAVYRTYCASRINWPQTPRSRRVGYFESNAVSPEALVSKCPGEALLNWFKTSPRRQAPFRRFHRHDTSFSQLQNRKRRSKRDARSKKKKRSPGGQPPLVSTSSAFYYPRAEFEYEKKESTSLDRVYQLVPRISFFFQTNLKRSSRLLSSIYHLISAT